MTNRPTDQQTNTQHLRLKLATTFAIAFLFLATIILRAAWTEPSQAPPAGNVAVPLYSTGSQSLDGSLSVGTPGSYTTGLSGTGSTSGVQGNSTAGNAIFGNLATGGAGGQRAIYGLAVDANDYGLYTSGGLGIGLASGDIWFTQQGSGVSWPRESDGVSLYGVFVTTDGELQLRGHGAGINLMDQNAVSRLTVSEAGVVNVASGGKLQVNSVDVCLKDGTNCSSISTPSLQAVTDQGSVTTNTLDLKGGINNSAGDLIINDWVDVQWGLKNSTANNGGNLYVSDNAQITGNLDINGSLGNSGGNLYVNDDFKVSGGGAFGGYDPDASHKVTTPSFYGLTAEVGDIKINKLNSAYGSDGIQNAATAERQYKTLPLIDNNDYFCPVGFVMIGVRNTNPAQLICGKLW